MYDIKISHQLKVFWTQTSLLVAFPHEFSKVPVHESSSIRKFIHSDLLEFNSTEGENKGEIPCNEYRFSIWNDEKVLETVTRISINVTEFLKWLKWQIATRHTFF